MRRIFIEKYISGESTYHSEMIWQQSALPGSKYCKESKFYLEFNKYNEIWPWILPLSDFKEITGLNKEWNIFPFKSSDIFNSAVIIFMFDNNFTEKHLWSTYQLSGMGINCPWTGRD